METRSSGRFRTKRRRRLLSAAFGASSVLIMSGEAAGGESGLDGPGPMPAIESMRDPFEFRAPGSPGTSARTQAERRARKLLDDARALTVESDPARARTIAEAGLEILVQAGMGSSELARDLARLRDECAKAASRRPEDLDISVGGIIWEPGAATAFVNGRVVSVGDAVSGARVVEITRGEVVFELGGQRFSREP